MFEGLIPANFVRPTPQDAQETLDNANPGDAIICAPEVYPNLTHTRHGLDSAPIWLLSEVLHQAVVKDTRTSGQGGGIVGWKIDNIITAGFDVVPFFRGIYFGANNERIARNIGVYCNIVRASKEDCYKISHIDNVEFIGNDAEWSGMQKTGQGELFDFVSVHGLYMARCKGIGSHSTASGIFAKGGTRDGVIEFNFLDQLLLANGISGGGATGADIWRDEDSKKNADGSIKLTNGQRSGLFECKNVIIRKNWIGSCKKIPLQFRGAHDSTGEENYLIGSADSIDAIQLVKEGNPDGTYIYCTNVKALNNLLAGADKGITPESGTVGFVNQGNAAPTTPGKIEDYFRTPDFLSTFYAEKFPYVVQTPPDADPCAAEKAHILEQDAIIEKLTADLNTANAKIAAATKALT